jgi:hypothetical protein
MKKSLKFILVLTSLFILSGCLTDSSDDEGEDLFEVPFEMFVPVNELPDGTYTVANGQFRAYFEPRDGATSYELTTIREDGTRGGSLIQRPDELTSEDERLRYQVTIGSIRIYMGVSEAEKNEAVEFFMNQLREAKPNFGSLEVKVIRE